MRPDDPTPARGVPALTERIPKPTSPCDRADCPALQKRRKSDQFPQRLRPYIDIGKIMVLLAMGHLILKLVVVTGVVVTEMRLQTQAVIDIHRHLNGDGHAEPGRK